MVESAPHLPVLADAALGTACRVVQVIAPAAAPDWAERLSDIGFHIGERVTVLRRGMPGGEPLAVQVGAAVFALRRAEAACIRIAPLEPQ